MAPVGAAAGARSASCGRTGGGVRLSPGEALLYEREVLKQRRCERLKQVRCKENAFARSKRDKYALKCEEEEKAKREAQVQAELEEKRAHLSRLMHERLLRDAQRGGAQRAATALDMSRENELARQQVLLAQRRADEARRAADALAKSREKKLAEIIEEAKTKERKLQVRDAELQRAKDAADKGRELARYLARAPEDAPLCILGWDDRGAVDFSKTCFHVLRHAEATDLAAGEQEAARTRVPAPVAPPEPAVVASRPRSLSPAPAPTPEQLQIADARGKAAEAEEVRRRRDAECEQRLVEEAKRERREKAKLVANAAGLPYAADRHRPADRWAWRSSGGFGGGSLPTDASVAVVERQLAEILAEAHKAAPMYSPELGRWVTAGEDTYVEKAVSSSQSSVSGEPSTDEMSAIADAIQAAGSPQPAVVHPALVAPPAFACPEPQLVSADWQDRALPQRAQQSASQRRAAEASQEDLQSSNDGLLSTPPSSASRVKTSSHIGEFTPSDLTDSCFDTPERPSRGRTTTTDRAVGKNQQRPSAHESVIRSAGLLPDEDSRTGSSIVVQDDLLTQPAASAARLAGRNDWPASPDFGRNPASPQSRISVSPATLLQSPEFGQRREDATRQQVSAYRPGGPPTEALPPPLPKLDSSSREAEAPPSFERMAQLLGEAEALLSETAAAAVPLLDERSNAQLRRSLQELAKEGLAAAQPQQRRERPAAPQGVVAPAAAASPQAGHASAPSPAAPASLNSRWGAQELSAQLDQICRELDAAVEVLPD
eukprot:TRINITY_DN11192_c0_g1_i2.p1 TRINITY_DN11192_c0_g1~~TRINITY_DN11192_c0_g1_i2.p1  ORF type:complete len:775 (-),score=191.14 TRINITY_DN11192_c0_g1_i2:103-2427(-)